MRSRRRGARPLETEETNFLGSVSDLMAGLLFVFIIMLMVFAINLRRAEESLQEQEETKREEIKQLRGADAARAQLLEELQTRLKKEGLAVEIDIEHGVLRLPEEILFRSGFADFQPGGRERLALVAQNLHLLLPCFTVSSVGVCPERTFSANLDAIMVEGHTDDVPLRPGMRFKDNWELSAARAIKTYEVLMEHSPELASFVNERSEPLFGVAGYADSRRVDFETTPEARARNRRIDLRLLMSPPDTSDVELPAHVGVDR